MKILLTTIHRSRLFTPLALLYLKTVLLKDRILKENIEIGIKEFSFLDSDDFILSEIFKFKPQIIGFSCYVWNIQRVLGICGKIKKINPNIKIILGGPQVSPLAENLLEQNPQIDMVVRGEGEVTFLELIKSLSDSKKNIKDLSGISYRHNGRILNNRDRPIIADLDSIPSPYLENSFNLENREACLETQRGCIFRCHFCYYNKGFDKVRFFSLKRVKNDLSFLLNQKLKSIYLMDPVFNLNVQRAKEICRFIAQNNKNNISFHAEIRAEFVDSELAELLYKANIKYLEIGVQSFKDNVLSSVGRKLNSKKFVNGLELFKKYDDIKTEMQLILGLPRETFFSFKKSLESAIDLDPKALTIFRLQVLPGTEIYKNAERLGIIYDKQPPYYFLENKSLSFKEVVELEKIIRSLVLFRKKITIKYLCKETKIKLLDIIKLWIEWLGDNKSLLNFQNNGVIKNKIREFIKYFCQKNNIDFDFYSALLEREEEFSLEAKREQGG